MRWSVTEWLNYFIKKAFEKMDAKNEKRAHLRRMLEDRKRARLQYQADLSSRCTSTGDLHPDVS